LKNHLKLVEQSRADVDGTVRGPDSDAGCVHLEWGNEYEISCTGNVRASTALEVALAANVHSDEELRVKMRCEAMCSFAPQQNS
jgi:hypothetical protein